MSEKSYYIRLLQRFSVIFLSVIFFSAFLANMIYYEMFTQDAIDKYQEKNLQMARYIQNHKSLFPDRNIDFDEIIQIVFPAKELQKFSIHFFSERKSWLYSNQTLSELYGNMALNPDERNLTDLYRTLPEIDQALKKGRGFIVRENLQKKKVLGIAFKVDSLSYPLIIHTIFPMKNITVQVRKLTLHTEIIIALVTFLILTLTFFGFQSIIEPIKKLEKETLSIADNQGKFSRPDSSSKEVRDLAKAINLVSKQFYKQMMDLANQKNEYKTLLANLREGVIALDNEKNVMLINESACRILGIEDKQYKGRPIIEVARNNPFVKFIDKANISKDRIFEEDFELYVFDEATTDTDNKSLPPYARKKYIHAQSSKVEDLFRDNYGLLIMLYDSTKVHKLENIRKEFVANVSHELKTPITTIQGFVETLLAEPNLNAANVKHFLQIIKNNGQRLNQIIDDLLMLAKMEQEGDASKISKSESSLKSIIESAVTSCNPRAEESDFHIQAEYPEELNLQVNSSLMEHALVNLIDNAIKYSQPGKKVMIYTDITDTDVYIHVKDWGEGIPLEKQQRLFERFYRLDKARSRQLGGTGLGLSIVKHIALAHGGNVSVESEPGSGSIFTIALPRLN